MLDTPEENSDTLNKLLKMFAETADEGISEADNQDRYEPKERSFEEQNSGIGIQRDRTQEEKAKKLQEKIMDAMDELQIEPKLLELSVVGKDLEEPSESNNIMGGFLMQNKSSMGDRIGFFCKIIPDMFSLMPSKLDKFQKRDMLVEMINRTMKITEK